MGLEFEGKTIATTDNGFLEDPADWTESLARFMAEQEGLALSDRHWDVIRYLRTEFVDNAGNQPNTRTLVKAMAEQWADRSVTAKTLYDLFPGDPSKQGGRLAGVPESRRKGGY